MAANQELLEKIFKHFDANGDGKISSSEVVDAVKKVAQNVSEDDIKRKMSEIDTDGDGFISLEEFNNFVNAHPESVEKVAKLFGLL